MHGGRLVRRNQAAVDRLCVHGHANLSLFIAGTVKDADIVHAAAESVYVSDISNQPCMVEEIGSLSPITLSDDYLPEYIENSLDYWKFRI